MKTLSSKANNIYLVKMIYHNIVMFMNLEFEH